MPAHQSFRHEALLYHDHDEYLDTVVPFLREGVERGEHVLVAVVEPAGDEIRERLGDAAGEVAFVDMSDLAANPARIMPALTTLVESHHHDGRAMRVLGQPVWAGRRDVEIVESRLHEGLINLVIPPDAPLWLICPYDASTGDPEVAEHAAHSHPVMLEKGDYRGSTGYTGAWYVENMFRRALPPAPDDAEVRTFRRAEIGEVANRVLATAFRAGLSVERSHRLAAAMRELASDATVGDTAVLRVWTDADAVVCEIEDPLVAAPVVGRVPTTTRAARKGLWLANQTSDLIQVRSTEAGTTVRVHTWR
ncbi:MEDS domain-containing protein [Nakamurella deserti]|uniref:MEDS domain-containing protein n=1 Tax=Nakamurella deserti TaxID=2164074 RepID=UPI000DBE3D5C|nr:MEDS domain-containing protein [Nakamurella deserti]